MYFPILRIRMLLLCTQGLRSVYEGHRVVVSQLWWRCAGRARNLWEIFDLHWVSVSTALPAVSWALPGDCSRPWRNTGAPTKMNFNSCSVVRLNYKTRHCDIGVWEAKRIFRVNLKDGITQDASLWLWLLESWLRLASYLLASAVLSFLDSPLQVRVPVVLSCHPCFLSLSAPSPFFSCL